MIASTHCRTHDPVGGGSNGNRKAAIRNRARRAVGALLLGSPDFLWVTRGAPVWGQDAALKRFAALYEATWQLDPELTSLKVIMIGEGGASLRPNHVYNRGDRTTAAANQVPHELGIGQNAGWLESVNHLANPRPRTGEVINWRTVCAAAHFVAYWPIASFRGNAANGRFRRYSDRRWRLIRDRIETPAFALSLGGAVLRPRGLI